MSFFKQAKPVWITNWEHKYNQHLLLADTLTVKEGQQTTIQIACADAFQLFVNGAFVFFGPARTAAGYFRVEEIDLTGSLSPGENYIQLLVAGYQVNSYQYARSEPFIQCEVFVDGQSQLATGTDFFYQKNPVREQRSPRYSFQRPFTEVYDFSALSSSQYYQVDKGENQPVTVQKEKQLLSKRSADPKFPQRLGKPVLTNTFKQTKNRPMSTENPRFYSPNDTFETFPIDQLVCSLGDEMLDITFSPSEEFQGEQTLTAGHSITYTLGRELSGFLALEATVSEPAEVYLLFDEILLENDVDPYRLGCINAVKYTFQPGEQSVISFEPYSAQYIKVVCTQGALEIGQLSLIEYINGADNAVDRQWSNPAHQRIFDAAYATYQQNAVDLFTDCPSRERAGWLCDSFFMGRAEYHITGGNDIEHDFLENFILHQPDGTLPEGVIPMCYPAYHMDHNFIPNWCMWFVIELAEHTQRTDDKLAKQAKDMIYRLLKYFEGKENEDGLLERLEAWVFNEWSRSSDFMQDVNYPTNMLYCGMLDAVAALYDDQNAKSKADTLRTVIFEQAYNGQFFVDNAVLEDGKAVVQNNTSEICQYFAFYFGIVTPEDLPTLWDTMLTEFGPRRDDTAVYPKVYKTNAFIGNFIRLDLLSREGYGEQVVEEIVDYFDYMALRTGTLWEQVSDIASCNHGFAGYVMYLLDENIQQIENKHQI